MMVYVVSTSLLIFTFTSASFNTMNFGFYLDGGVLSLGW